MVDLEVEKDVDDIDTKGMDPISKLLDYTPPRKGKVNITKDPNIEKFLIHTPLLPKSITFEGLRLARVPHLKMEDIDFADHERFPHLVT